MKLTYVYSKRRIRHYDSITIPVPLDGYFIGCNFAGSSAGKVSTWNAGNPSLIPGWEDLAWEGIGYPLQYSWASLVTQLVKNPPSVWETWVQSLGLEDPRRREWLSTPVFWPGKFHELYTVWGVAKSQTLLSDFCWPNNLIIK